MCVLFVHVWFANGNSMQFCVVNAFSFKVINLHPKGKIMDAFGMQQSRLRPQICLGTASNYFLYTEFESDTSLELQVFIYRSTKQKGSSKRTWEVTIVMETNSLGSICFQSFGGDMMGQQKVQNMLIKGEDGCFLLTPDGWVGLLKTPRNTHAT